MSDHGGVTVIMELDNELLENSTPLDTDPTEVFEEPAVKNAESFFQSITKLALVATTALMPKISGQEFEQNIQADILSALRQNNNQSQNLNCKNLISISKPTRMSGYEYNVYVSYNQLQLLSNELNNTLESFNNKGWFDADIKQAMILLELDILRCYSKLENRLKLLADDAQFALHRTTESAEFWRTSYNEAHSTTEQLALLSHYVTRRYFAAESAWKKSNHAEAHRHLEKAIGYLTQAAKLLPKSTNNRLRSVIRKRIDKYTK